MSDAMKMFEALLTAAKAGENGRAVSSPPGVEWEGTKIKLPAEPQRMGLAEGAEWLNKQLAADEKAVQIVEEVDCYPWEGAIAFIKATRELYGYTDAKPTTGMFGMKSPPMLISIETGVGETEQIFWGTVELPGIPGNVTTGAQMKRGRQIFCLNATVRQKHAGAIKLLANRVREIVAESSIYRGKAIKLHTDSNGDMDWNSPPSFLDLRKVDPADLIFSQDLQDQIQTNLFTPIQHAELCRQNKVPLKRGVLLAGPYGTGKTLCASVVGKLCQDNGVTYITVGRVTALKAALEFAAHYQQAVVFVEDIDREMAGERTTEMDDILNTIDGVSAKGTEIMVVLTSNHVEKINRAMLRPGRLDAVLMIDPPDADAAEKLIRLYGRRLITSDTNLSDSKQELAGQIPAVIRECVERAKLHAISLRPGLPFELLDEDVSRAARTMKHHLALLAEPEKEKLSVGDKMLAALAEGVNEHLGNGSDTGLSAKVQEIRGLVEDIRDNQ